MLCTMKYVHAAAANTGGLKDYSFYSGHLQFQNDHWGHGDQDQPLSLLTQLFHSMDKYTVKPVNQALGNKDTCIMHTLSFGPKYSFIIRIIRTPW